MWGNANPDRPHDPSQRWNCTPALRRIRRVLILVDITQTQQLVEEQFSAAMSVTSCEHLFALQVLEDQII